MPLVPMGGLHAHSTCCDQSCDTAPFCCLVERRASDAMPIWLEWQACGCVLLRQHTVGSTEASAERSDVVGTTFLVDTLLLVS